MNNNIIYPYGTDGQLSSSIGLVNDLETGGYDKALGASQGPVIAEMIENINSVIYGAEYTDTLAVDFSTATIGYFSQDTDMFYNKSVAQSYSGYIIPVENWKKITITANSTKYTKVFVSKSLIPYDSITKSVMLSTYMSNCYTPSSGEYYILLSAGDSVEITFASDSKYLYIQKEFTDYTGMTPESAVFSSEVRHGGLVNMETSGGLYEGIGFVRGTLDEEGKIVDSDNHLVSNPIPMTAGHFLSVDTNSGYYIESIALYNANGKCVNRKYLYPIATLVGNKYEYGNNVCVAGYYVRYVLVNQSRDASLTDNPVKIFVLANDSRLSKVMPDNATKYPLFQERVRLLTNAVWKPLRKVAAINSKNQYYYDAGGEVIGIPYSEVAEYSKFVGYHVSMRTFLTALLNKRSVMYTENVSSEASSSKYDIIYHNVTNASGAYYGTVCTGLTSFVMGLPDPIESIYWGVGDLEDETLVGKGDNNHYYYIRNDNSWEVSNREAIWEAIQPMDIIKTPGHCSVISDIYKDNFGKRKFVVWTEETSGDFPSAKSTIMDWDRFFERLDYAATRQDLANHYGWVISRYPMDGVTSIGNEKNYVPMSWFESPKEVTIDPDICTYAGDYVCFPIGDPSESYNNNKVFLNIHRDGGKYDTLQIFYESANVTQDSPVAEVDISSNNGTFIYNSDIFDDDASDKDDWIIVDLKQLQTPLTHGKYKARVIDSNDETVASGFTHFEMVDIDFNIAAGSTISNFTVEFSSSEGTPYYLRREKANGYGATMSKQIEIQEGQTSKTLSSWGFNSTDRYLKIFVRGEYGVAVKRIDVYAYFNS